MKKARFFNTMRGFTILVILITVVLLPTALYLKNRQGISGRTKTYIQDILGTYYINSKLERFHYSILEGVIVKNLTILSREDDEKVCAEFKKIAIAFDRKAITQGEFNLETVTVKQGTAWIDLQDEENNRIKIDNIHAKLDFTRGYDIIIQNFSAKINGIPVELEGESLGLMQPKDTKSQIDIPIVLRRIFEHLYNIHFPVGQEPLIKVRLTHTYEATSGLDIDVNLESDALTYYGYDFTKVSMDVQYANKTVYLKRSHILDDTGEASGTGSYKVQSRTGEYDMVSTMDIPKILRNFSISSFANKLVSPLPPLVTAKGVIQGTQHKDKVSWDLATHGHLKLNEFRLLGTTFDSLDTDFSWREGKLFFRDMTVNHELGEVQGKLMIENQNIRYEATSTLPISLYSPFIEEGGILARNIEKTDFTDDSTIELYLKGSTQRDQINKWEASGNVSLTNISYNGVPLKSGSSEFIFTPIESVFDNIEAVFNYDDYSPSSYVTKNSKQGSVTAKKIRYDSPSKTVKITDLTGTAWPAPIISLFAPSIGEFLDDTLYYTSPPSFTTNGTIGIQGNPSQTKLDNKLNKPLSFYYTTLGKDIYYKNVDTNIRLDENSILIQNISGNTLGGKMAGNLKVDLQSPSHRKGRFGGDLTFSGIGLENLAERYQFENKTNGNLTGRISFSGIPNDVRSLDGEGFIELNKADLFYIPIFGPLSPLISTVLGHRKTSHERVKSVSAGYLIKNGIILTDSLSSSTPSAKISGGGRIDLESKGIDFRIKANTKGLLGFLTLPIKPLEGFLHFNGTGTVSDPQWKSSPFQSTKKYIQSTEHNSKATVVE